MDIAWEVLHSFHIMGVVFIDMSELIIVMIVR